MDKGSTWQFGVFDKLTLDKVAPDVNATKKKAKRVISQTLTRPSGPIRREQPSEQRSLLL